MNSGRLIFSVLARNMLPTKASGNQAIAAIGNAVRNSSAYKPAASWKPPHFDEMPVPGGSWQTEYNNKQTKYNMHLIVGVTFFLLTVTFVRKSGIIFFNSSPPPLPEDDCE